MSFRIAIGRCACEEPYRDRIEAIACRLVSASLESWRDRLPADLSAIPAEAHEELEVEDLSITVGTYRNDLGDGATLVAFQVLVHTWSRPTYISFGTVGRMYSEGLYISPSGVVERASDELMWEFR